MSATDPQCQNIYDNPQFFEGYSRLGRSVDGLNGAPEWPALRALVPPLKGLRVVDLGCGFGWFCRWATTQGAAGVRGLDVSERMLERARAMTADPAITYLRVDLEKFHLDAASSDFVFSSLALHYISNLSGLLATVYESLVPGGSFVCSLEHPIYMAPTHPAWVRSDAGRRVWPLDRYLLEGPRTTDWLTRGVIKQHRTIGTTLNHLIRQGFAIGHVEEWGPTDEQVAAHPDWAESRERPMFLLIAARR